MTWIKRNLFFLIGILVALGLIGAGGYYCYSEYTRGNELGNQVQEVYNKLKDLAGKKPHPGDPSGVDNVKAAREQMDQMNKLAEQLRAGFKPIPQPPVNASFRREMDSAISELQKSATEAGVALPSAGYLFTFDTENKMVNLPAQESPKIAVHLSEIKAICDILIAAKVNSIDNIQRPAIAGLETNSSNFLPPPTNSTPLADLTPYKVSFHCFSGELSSVVTRLAASPYALVVKYLDVDPGTVSTARVSPPPRGNPRPNTYLNENPLGVTLMIEVIKPKTPPK